MSENRNLEWEETNRSWWVHPVPPCSGQLSSCFWCLEIPVCFLVLCFRVQRLFSQQTHNHRFLKQSKGTKQVCLILLTGGVWSSAAAKSWAAHMVHILLALTNMQRCYRLSIEEGLNYRNWLGAEVSVYSTGTDCDHMLDGLIHSFRTFLLQCLFLSRYLSYTVWSVFITLVKEGSLRSAEATWHCFGWIQTMDSLRLRSNRWTTLSLRRLTKPEVTNRWCTSVVRIVGQGNLSFTAPQKQSLDEWLCWEGLLNRSITSVERSTGLTYPQMLHLQRYHISFCFH